MPACLNCNYNIEFLEGAFGNEPRGPDPGDYVICSECGFAQAVGDNSIGFRQLTPREGRFVRSLRKKTGMEIIKH